MIQTIRLDRVLREAVATPYRNLVTRPTGALVRRCIEATLADTGCRIVLLDFSDVALLDLSCADEIVAKLLLAAGAERLLYVVLAGLHDHQREAIEHVLTHHGLAVLAVCPDDGISVLGRVPDDARTALRWLTDRATGADAETLARALEWDVQRARWALDTLAAQRLVHREAGAFLPLRVA
jgi:hypothetical protein